MPAQLLNAPLYQLALAVVVASLAVSILMTYPLKFAAESVFKFPVSLLQAFKAMFAATLALTALVFGLIRFGLVDLAAGGGIALQVLGLVVGLLILAFTITVTLRTPDGQRPDFAQSGVVAAIMQVIALLIALAITFAVGPMTVAT